MTRGSNHIPFTQVVDLAEGRLSADDQALAQTHTAECDQCAAQLTWLERVIGLMRTDQAEDSPAHVVGRAVALFEARRAPAPSPPRQRRPAALRFDSWRSGAALGMRGGARTERQLLFNADGFDVDVRISRSGELWTIAGQVLGPEQSGLVTLHGLSSTLRDILNDMSEFKLSPVSPGTYTLIVQLATVEVEISGLEVGV